jgi:hypothetical protein
MHFAQALKISSLILTLHCSHEGVQLAIQMHRLPPVCLSCLSVWLFAKTTCCLTWTTCRAACSAWTVCNKTDFFSKVTFIDTFSACAFVCCVCRVCNSAALLSMVRCWCSNLSSLALRHASLARLVTIANLPFQPFNMILIHAH